MRLGCKVEVDGKMGTVVRTNVFRLSSSNGVVVEFVDGSRKMFINDQMKCISECE